MKPLVEPFGDDTITLRLVEERDLETILNWRNRDESRVWFKTPDRLTFDSHRRWHERYLTSNDDFFFLIEAEGMPVGQCAIYNIERVAGSAEIGRFLAAPGKSGHGYITRSCEALVRFGIGTLNLSYLYLEVMSQNDRAIGIYKRCGFVEESRSDGLIRMGLRRDRL
ncbi:GCN5-related N-acetyltransferase [Bradyrhizobiaceae bacterium SG-6C]|nr:GCN5-related N-acetyltransferase [Bradyrhizobiaceae bacterium SG-6C]